jgi:DNA-binding winged helix-turn-helix (wHTH) protein/tetratricopeptide (TPR) repeat protein/TolB-like protein
MNNGTTSHVVYEFGGYRLDPGGRRLARSDGETIAVTAKAFDALVYLVTHPGRVITRAELTNFLWPSTVVEENNLNQAIWTLRRALRDSSSGPRYIATVPGRGYQFVAAVSTMPPEPPAGTGAAPLVPAQSTAPGTGAAAGARGEVASGVPRGRRWGLAPAAVGGAALVAAGAIYVWLGLSSPVPGAGEAVTMPMVIVLPFVNESGADDDIVDRVSEEVRDRLTTAPGLRVYSRPSSLAFSGTADPQAVALRLDRAAVIVVAGKLSRRGDGLHLSVETIDGATGLLLGTPGTYELSRANVTAVTHQIASLVVGQIVPGVALPADSPARLISASAQELIWLGRSYELAVRDQLVVDEQLLQRAIDNYRRAMEADPQSALAHSRLAATLLYAGDVDAASEHIVEALALDPELSDTYYTQALLLIRTGQSGIQASYERAVTLNPNNVDALGAYAQWIWGHANVASAEEYFRQALELDPLSLSRYTDYAEYLGGTNRRERALELAEQIRTRFDDARGYLALARVYELTGDLDVGIAWARKAYDLQPHNRETADQLAELYARIGDFAMASRYEPEPGMGQLYLQRRYEELIEIGEEMLLDGTDDPNVFFMLGFAYNAVGQFHPAVHVLTRAGLPAIAEAEGETAAQKQALMSLVDAWQAIEEDEQARPRAELIRRRSQTKVATGAGDAWWPNAYLACAEAALGRDAEAFAALERIERSIGLVWLPLLRDGQCFRRYVGDPRYESVIAQVEERLRQLRERLPATLREHGLTP